MCIQDDFSEVLYNQIHSCIQDTRWPRSQSLNKSTRQLRSCRLQFFLLLIRKQRRRQPRCCVVLAMPFRVRMYSRAVMDSSPDVDWNLRENPLSPPRSRNKCFSHHFSNIECSRATQLKTSRRLKDQGFRSWVKNRKRQLPVQHLLVLDSLDSHTYDNVVRL